MDVSKCNIYFGNLKIKTGYFGQYKFYEDSKPNGLYFIQLVANSTTRVITPIKYNTTSELNMLKLGGV